MSLVFYGINISVAGSKIKKKKKKRKKKIPMCILNLTIQLQVRYTFFGMQIWDVMLRFFHFQSHSRLHNPTPFGLESFLYKLYYSVSFITILHVRCPPDLQISCFSLSYTTVWWHLLLIITGKSMLDCRILSPDLLWLLLRSNNTFIDNTMNY